MTKSIEASNGDFLRVRFLSFNNFHGFVRVSNRERRLEGYGFNEKRDESILERPHIPGTIL